MITRILQADRAGIEEAGALLRAGELCAIPTETVYGLAADGLNPQAVLKIFQAKGRPQDNPLILHIADLEMLPRLCEVNEAARKLAKAFWPGPLTMVLPRRECVPNEVTAGLPGVAVRMPASPIARAIIKAAGTPLAAPSANLSGLPSPTRAGHVAKDMGGLIAGIVDGGACAVGIESTVISLMDTPRILRPGLVTPEELRSVLGEVVMDSAVFSKLAPDQKALSPGMKYKHYAPKATMYLIRGEFDAVGDYIRARCVDANTTGVLCFPGEEGDFPKACCVPFGCTDEEHARGLFSALRAFDETGVSTIYSRMPGGSGVGLAVLNRMIRAAAYRIIDV